MLISSGAVADGQLNLSLGYEQTSGDYGLTNDTDITTIPFVAQYTEGTWRVTLTIPYISVTGDGSIVPGSHGGTGGHGMMNTTGSGGALVQETHSGAGDITTSVSHAFLPANDHYMFYELTGSVKWGTASARDNLGTGENDFSLKLFSKYEKHNLKPFASVGYIFVGDTQSVNYNDALFASAGLVYHFAATTSFSVVYDYQQATSDGSDDGRMASLYINRALNRQWSANVYLLKGLSDSEADTGVGFTVIHSY
ncbi:MAG: DUF3187 family protein [Gammaproteobacteria bacterium]